MNTSSPISIPETIIDFSDFHRYYETIICVIACREHSAIVRATYFESITRSWTDFFGFSSISKNNLPLFDILACLKGTETAVYRALTLAQTATIRFRRGNSRHIQTASVFNHCIVIVCRFMKITG